MCCWCLLITGRVKRNEPANDRLPPRWSCSLWVDEKCCQTYVTLNCEVYLQSSLFMNPTKVGSLKASESESNKCFNMHTARCICALERLAFLQPSPCSLSIIPIIKVTPSVGSLFRVVWQCRFDNCFARKKTMCLHLHDTQLHPLFTAVDVIFPFYAGRGARKILILYLCHAQYKKNLLFDYL